MIRRNLLGQFFTVAILLCLLVIIVTIARYFDFSADWIDGPVLTGRPLYAIQTAAVIIAVIVGILSFIGQFISRAKKYSGFAVFLLFCTWIAVAIMMLVAFFDVIFDPEIDDFGALQQVTVVLLGLAVFAGTWLYTTVKFPEYKDVEFIKSVIEKEVDRAVYKPDLSCEKCGEGLKEEWEFCPSCGGMMIGDDDIVLTDYEVIVEDEPKFAPPARKKRGLFGRRRSKKEEPEDEFVLDEDEPELEAEPEGDAPPDEDFIDKFDKKAAGKKSSKKEKKKETSGVTRVQCEKCSTLLEIRNPKRPLHVRCPDCKNIWELKE